MSRLCKIQYRSGIEYLTKGSYLSLFPALQGEKEQTIDILLSLLTHLHSIVIRSLSLNHLGQWLRLWTCWCSQHKPAWRKGLIRFSRFPDLQNSPQPSVYTKTNSIWNVYHAHHREWSETRHLSFTLLRFFRHEMSPKIHGEAKGTTQVIGWPFGRQIIFCHRWFQHQLRGSRC